MIQPYQAPVSEIDAMQAASVTLSYLVADMSSGEILFATRPMEMLFGYDIPGDLAQRNVDELVPDRLRSGHTELRKAYTVNPSRRTMGGANRQNLMGLRPDGSIFPVVIGLNPVVVNRTRRCVVVSAIDMSEPATTAKQAIKEAAFAAAEIVRDTAAKVAEELKEIPHKD
jgi:PAS domain S-box-containing protein